MDARVTPEQVVLIMSFFRRPAALAVTMVVALWVVLTCGCGQLQLLTTPDAQVPDAGAPGGEGDAGTGAADAGPPWWADSPAADNCSILCSRLLVHHCFPARCLDDCARTYAEAGPCGDAYLALLECAKVQSLDCFRFSASPCLTELGTFAGCTGTPDGGPPSFWCEESGSSNQTLTGCTYTSICGGEGVTECEPASATELECRCTLDGVFLGSCKEPWQWPDACSGEVGCCEPYFFPKPEVPTPPCAGAGSWKLMTGVGSPWHRQGHVHAWTGTEFVLWGGVRPGWEQGLGQVFGSGGRYDPKTNTWTATSDIAAPSARHGASGVWTGSRLIVFGGNHKDGGWEGYEDPVDAGAAYDPATNTWAPIGLTGAPPGRAYHAAVWTGSRMIIWGGNGQTGALTDGAIFDPVTDSWTPIASAGAPSPRLGESALWTGSRMIIWGGITAEGPYDGLSTGSLYDPATDTWTPMSSAAAPTRRGNHAAVWTGSRMIVYGGYGGADSMWRGDGAAYDPTTDTWSPLPATGGPGVLRTLGAVWTGSAMLVIGVDYAGPRAASYDPATNAWSPLGTCDAPKDIGLFNTTVWTGTKALLWPVDTAGAIFTP